MATIDFTSAVARRWAPGGWQPGVFHLYNKMDFSVQNAASSDTVQCLTIPAGTLVTNVMHIVHTAEGGTSTATVGDGDDNDGWMASVDNNATAGTVVLSNATGTLTAGTVDQKLISGGAAGAHTVTGVGASDRLVGVMHYTPATSLADLTSEFSITGADTIDNTGGTDTSSDQLLVTWQAQSSFADDSAIAAAGGKYYSSEDTIDMYLSANAVDTAVIEMVAVCVDLAY